MKITVKDSQTTKIFYLSLTLQKKGGTGLGLAICKKIVEEHNGEITLYSSKILGGAGVKIILPYGDI